MAEKWKHSAKKAGVSLSRFLRELVEQRIENGEFQSITEKERQISEFQRKFKSSDLKSQHKRKKHRCLRALQHGWMKKIERYETRRSLKMISMASVLDLLHISPTDSDSTKLIMKLLSLLEKY